MAYRNKLRDYHYPALRGPNEDELRATGRSTADALEALAVAMRNPGRVVRVKDHFGSRVGDMNVLHTARDQATKLGLQHLTFNEAALTIRYDVLEWIPE